APPARTVPATETAELEERERLRESLHLDRDGGRNLGNFADALVRASGDEHLSAEVDALPRGDDIARAADHRVFAPLLGPDVAAHRPPRIDADAHLEARQPGNLVLAVDLRHGALHGERAPSGA